MISIWIIPILYLPVISVSAQSNWNFPDNEKEIILTSEKMVLYSDLYKMFALAGNKEGIQRVKEQIPTMETIFFNNMEEGENITVVAGSTKQFKL